MAAEALGIAARPHPHRQRRHRLGARFAGNAGGSKITLTVGAAVVQAAGEARAADLRHRRRPAGSRPRRSRARRRPGPGAQARPSAASAWTGSARSARPTCTASTRPSSGSGRSGIDERAPGIAAHLARVRVDPDTHEPQVIEYVAIQDVGRRDQPGRIEDQIHGGVAQGIGWALYEGIVLRRRRPRHDRQPARLRPPAARQDPADRDRSCWRSPRSPGRSACAASASRRSSPVAAAIGNAIRDAAGVRLTEIPMTAERSTAPSPPTYHPMTLRPCQQAPSLPCAGEGVGG